HRRTQTSFGPGIFGATVRNGGIGAAGAAAVGQKRLLDVRRGRARGNGPRCRRARPPSGGSRGRDATVLPGHARTAGPTRARPVCRRVLSGSRAHRPTGSVSAIWAGSRGGQDRSGVPGSTRGARVTQRSGVFGRDYAAAYDDLYQDKDYVAECDLIERVFETYGQGPTRRVLDL